MNLDTIQLIPPTRQKERRPVSKSSQPRRQTRLRETHSSKRTQETSELVVIFNQPEISPEPSDGQSTSDSKDIKRSCSKD